MPRSPRPGAAHPWLERRRRRSRRRHPGRSLRLLPPHPTRCCRSPAPRAPPAAGRPPPTAARSYRDTPALRGMLASLAVGEGRRGHFRTETRCFWSRSFLLLELAQERAEHGGLLKTWHHGLCLYEKVSEVTQVKGMRTTWFLVWWIETTTSPRQSCS